MSILRKLNRAKSRAIENFIWKKIAKVVKTKVPFDINNTPPPPNYSNIDHWASHPDKNDKSSFVPAGIPINHAPKNADVFYVHPTLFFSPKRWNANLDNTQVNELIDEVVIPHQVSVFNGSCRIFAPRYRQATFHSFIEISKDSEAALSFAYQDVAKAFKYYLENLNDGRPFFLAGHSQGCLHVIRLLEEEVENKDCLANFIAAYAIGFQFPKDKFGTSLHNIKPSNSPLDHKSVIAWDTYILDGQVQHQRDHVQQYYAKTKTWEPRAYKPIISINPLSFTQEKKWFDSSYNQGSTRVLFEDESKFDIKKAFGGKVMGIKSIGLSAPILGEVGARLDEEGFLRISKPKTARFNMGVMPGGNYHNHDITLFYMNIRENIGHRLDAYLKENQVKSGVTMDASLG